MKDFIIKLYENDNFTLYLTIALVVLVILFVLVLIFGKKDQKLEETKKLLQIELDKNKNKNAFKEEPSEPVKIEMEKPLDNEKQNIENTVVEKTEEPAIEQAIEMVKEPENVEVTEFEPAAKEIAFEKEPMVALEKDDLEEEKPINVENIPAVDFDEITNSLEEGLNNLASIKNEFNTIEVPEMVSTDTMENKIEIVDNEEKEEKNFQPTQVFSSVFVKKEDNENGEQVEMNSIEIEPEIKIENTVKKEKPTLIIQDNNDDEDDFDLPDLKVADTPVAPPEKKEEPVEEKESSTEEKEEMLEIQSPNETSFSFDDLLGETYNLK